MVRVIAKPEETEGTLDALLATTFVIRVDRATLSVIAPLLSKCLRSRQSNMHRKAGMVSCISVLCFVRIGFWSICDFIRPDAVSPPLPFPSTRLFVSLSVDTQVLILNAVLFAEC